MVAQMLLLATLLGGPLTSTNNEAALKAIQRLYQYSTHAVEVDPAELQQLLASVEAKLGSLGGETARTYERLAAEVHKDRPDGREIRVVASDLYRVVESQDG
jgi:hypothetical protein